MKYSITFNPFIQIIHKSPQSIIMSVRGIGASPSRQSGRSWIRIEKRIAVKEQTAPPSKRVRVKSPSKSPRRTKKTSTGLSSPSAKAAKAAKATTAATVTSASASTTPTNSSLLVSISASTTTSASAASSASTTTTSFAAEEGTVSKTATNATKELGLMEPVEIGGFYYFKDFAVEFATKITKEVLRGARNVFHKLEELGVEDVRVVILAKGAKAEHILKVSERTGETKGLKIIILNDMLVIVASGGVQHQDGCMELVWQIKNYVNQFRQHLRVSGDATRPEEFEGRAVDVNISSRWPDDPNPEIPFGFTRVAIELADKNESGSALRQRGHFLFNNQFVDGLHIPTLRALILIKVYPPRVQGGRSVLVVYFERDAHHHVQFRTAISIGDIPVSARALQEWHGLNREGNQSLPDIPDGEFVDAPVPPAVPVQGVHYHYAHPGVNATLTVPAAQIWFNILDAQGQLVAQPAGMGDLILDLRMVMECFAL
jgi:hypothetical protein